MRNTFRLLATVVVVTASLSACSNPEQEAKRQAELQEQARIQAENVARHDCVVASMNALDHAVTIRTDLQIQELLNVNTDACPNEFRSGFVAYKNTVVEMKSVEDREARYAVQSKPENVLGDMLIIEITGAGSWSDPLKQLSQDKRQLELDRQSASDEIRRALGRLTETATAFGMRTEEKTESKVS